MRNDSGDIDDTTTRLHWGTPTLFLGLKTGRRMLNKNLLYINILYINILYIFIYNKILNKSIYSCLVFWGGEGTPKCGVAVANVVVIVVIQAL